MRVTYAGVFWEDRVPDHFLRALQLLLQEHPSLRGKIEALFVGNFRDENLKLVERLGLQDSVTVAGYVPHRECVRFLLDSDLLWMVVGDDRGSPGKAYEYIGAGKPILGCVPEGFLRSALLEAGATVVGPTDVRGIASALLESHRLFERNALRGPSKEVIEKYDRRLLTGSLVKVFNSLFEP